MVPRIHADVATVVQRWLASLHTGEARVSVRTTPKGIVKGGEVLVGLSLVG